MTAVIHQFSNYYPLRTTMKKTIINVFSTLAAVALSSVSVYAAGTDTWVGNTDANWSTAANWTTSGGSTPPANGDSLVFGAAGSAGASLNNDISGLTVNNINLNGPGSFTFGVNGLALNGTLTAAATVNETFSGGITIGSDVATAIKNTGSGTLALGALSENSGGTVDFLINGPITTTTANVNGILGGWATTNNSVSSATVGGWAANDGSGNIISYAGYTAGVPSGVNNTGNYRGGNANVAANATVNSFVFDGSGDVTINNGVTLTLSSGGLFIGGTQRWLKAGNSTSTIKSGLATGEIYLHCNNGTFTDFQIQPVIADGSVATKLIKDGPGVLKFASNVKTYTGGTVVNGGTLALNVGGGTGSIRGTATVNPGATLGLIAIDAVGYNAGVCVNTLNVVGGTVANSSGGNEGFIMNLNLTGGTVTSTGGNYVFSGGYGISSLASPLTSLISAPLNIQARARLMSPKEARPAATT